VTRVAILSDYQGVALALADWSEVEARAELVALDGAYADEDVAAAELADFEVLCPMRERVHFTASLIARLSRLRCIVTTGTRNNAIDLAAAAAAGVVVCGTTDGPGQVATAELIWGLVIAAARHIVAEENAVRAGRWQRELGTMLHGKALGILGLGGVGRHLARFGNAFGMEVLAWSPDLTAARAGEDAATCVSLGDLLEQADVLSVNAAANAETVGLIGREALGRMKRSAILVNASRGPLVDEAALVETLAEGRPAAVVLDVFDREPLPADSPLRRFPDRLHLSPHKGFVTAEVYRDFYRETVRGVVAYLDGEPIRVLT
jgi:phosphoglycerate dehydrogenase-like enzyme